MIEGTSLVLSGIDAGPWEQFADMGQRLGEAVVVGLDGEPDLGSEPLAFSVAQLQGGKVMKTICLDGDPAEIEKVKNSAGLYWQGHNDLVRHFHDHMYTYPPEYKQMARTVKSNRDNPGNLPAGSDGFLAGHFVYRDLSDKGAIAGALLVPRSEPDADKANVLWRPNTDGSFHEDLENLELVVPGSFPLQSLAAICLLVERGQVQALLVEEGYIPAPFWYGPIKPANIDTKGRGFTDLIRENLGRLAGVYGLLRQKLG